MADQAVDRWGLRPREQMQLRQCQAMLESLCQGEISNEEYDQHKRQLILALSKPVLGSQHAASAPSRLALLTELKNSGCILEVEYQWARVPIVCQVDLVKKPRKENRDPAQEQWVADTGAKQRKGERLSQAAYGGPPRRDSNGPRSPAPPLRASKYGPNVDKMPEHPLAPGTKDAFLLQRAALSGEGSELSKGRRVKRQPSFAGLGHARRSASFSAGESSVSEAYTPSRPGTKKGDLRSSLSFGSTPTADTQRRLFGRSVSFSGRPQRTPDPSPKHPSPSKHTILQPEVSESEFHGVGGSSVRLRLPPLAKRAPHARRLSLFEAATGLVRTPKEVSTREQAMTDSEANGGWHRREDVPRNHSPALAPQRGHRVESEPELVKQGSWALRGRKRPVTRGGFSGSENETWANEGLRGENRQGLDERGDFAERGRAATRHVGSESEAPRGRSRQPTLRSDVSSIERSQWQTCTESSATEWPSGTETNAKRTGGRGPFDRTARNGAESGDGSHDGLTRGKRGSSRDRTVGKVARQLLGSGHVLLKDWNKKGLRLVGLVKPKNGGRGSGHATEEETVYSDVPGSAGGSQREGRSVSERDLHQDRARLKAVKRGVQSTLDRWRHEACGPVPPQQFLTNEQTQRIAELLPQSLDDLNSVVTSSWIHRYGPYVVTIVREALSAAHIPPESLPAFLTSASTSARPLTSAPTSVGVAAVPPQRAPPPLPSSFSAASDADPSASGRSTKSYGTWARKGGRGQNPGCNAREMRAPGVTADSDEDLDVFSPGLGSLPPERVGNPRAGHANRRDYLRRSQEKGLRRSLDNASKTSPVNYGLDA